MGLGQGLGGASARKAADDSPKVDSGVKELLIDGKMYDVTDFVRKHPGGSVLTFYMGQDARLGTPLAAALAAAPAPGFSHLFCFDVPQ